MITDEIIKKKFAANVIKTGVETILAQQRSIAAAAFSNPGYTQSLSSSEYTIRDSSANVMLTVRILKVFRLQEIAAQRGLRTPLNIYNKIVFPYLYRTVLPSLRYGLSDEIRERYRKELESVNQ